MHPLTPNQTTLNALPAVGRPVVAPDAPAWRSALLPLAYAAGLMAVLLPLSQLWPEHAAGTPPVLGSGRAATTAVLAEQLGRRLARGADCVTTRWQASSLAAVDTCLMTGYGLAQVFVLPPVGSASAVKVLEPHREQALGWTVADLRRQLGAVGRVTHLPAPNSDSDPSPGVDQLVVMPAEQGGDVLVLRYRWSSLQLSTPTGEHVPESALSIQRASPAALGMAVTTQPGLLVAPVPQAEGLSLALREGAAAVGTETAMATRLPSLAWWSSGSVSWLAPAALSLLLVAGVALRLDGRWRAKERRYMAELDQKVRENDRLNARQQALNADLQARLLQNQELNDQLLKLNQELLDVVYASERLHTWRNMIGPVVNAMTRCLDWLQDRRVEGVDRQIDSLSNGLQAAQRLWSDLKQTSPPPEGMSNVAVHALVDEAFALSKIKASEAGVTLTSTVSQQLPVVRVERLLVKMALSSLIDNAVRAMATVPCGNRVVTVSARQDHTGARVRLTIRDNGIGISEAQRKAMLEGRFVKDGAPDGHGTGVARCKLILSRNNGSIGEIETGADGSAIEVHLPVANQNEEPE